MADAKFSIKAVSENATKTIVKARNFNMVIDEPPSLGGKDEGANPVEFVLAALAGCLNVMGNLIAKEMGFALKSFKINISGPLDPDFLFGKTTEGRAGYKEIVAELEVETDADKETLNKWIKAVESRCPVSDNLSNSTPLKVVLK